MRRARSLVPLVAWWILAPAMAKAYPIPPKPLWSLTAEADLIVVAEVAEVAEVLSLPLGGVGWDSAVARLRVIKTLKGPEKSLVKVPFAANLLCPAPAHYAEGETVVAFLRREEKKIQWRTLSLSYGTQWRTVSLSYGTLYPRGDDLEDVTTMVHAALVIQRTVTSSSELEWRKQEWMVQAAALPGTRWHGLYELAQHSDSLRSYYDQTERPERTLSKQELRLLATAFVDAPQVDHTAAMMLQVLGRFEDARVDDFAVGLLEGLLALERQPWWVRDVLWAVLARFGDENPEARLEAIGSTSWDVTSDQLRNIWDDGKAELGIPELAPLAIELESYLPVAGSTPD